MESAETVLPDPDSPTSATISPLAILKETPFTASTTLPAERNSTERLRTSTSGVGMAVFTGTSFWDRGRRARPRR